MSMTASLFVTFFMLCAAGAVLACWFRSDGYQFC